MEERTPLHLQLSSQLGDFFRFHQYLRYFRTLGYPQPALPEFVPVLSPSQCAGIPVSANRLEGFGTPVPTVRDACEIVLFFFLFTFLVFVSLRLDLSEVAEGEEACGFLECRRSVMIICYGRDPDPIGIG